MNLVVAVSVLIFFALGACLWLLVRSTRLTTGSLPVTTDWLNELSVGRYRPMLHLLDEGDLQLLSRQPGFSPRMVRKLRAQRCQIVRGYLRSMQVDFGRICTALKMILVQSQQDRPDLASALLQSQITFTFGMVAVQFRLLLYRWGLGRAEVTSLLKVFDGMRLELRRFVPVEASVGA